MLFGWFFCVYTPLELEMGNSVEDNAYLFPIKYMVKITISKVA
jgi:hypothetical protein